MPGPMQDVRVVELGVWVAGPAGGGILADWGADVVKIEPPGSGDPARSFAKILGGDLPFNPPFEMDNRSKRSIALDLSSEEGRALALELIDGADVFLSNIRSSALERLGLGPEALMQRNPRLIYASLTGYGLDGPDSDKPAYDIAAFWARSGIAWALTPRDADPPFQRGGMGDHGAGLSTAAAISAALYEREKSGKGQLVSTSLLRQGIYTISFDLAVTCRLGVSMQPGHRANMGNPTVNNYVAGDGKRFWIVGLEAERHWPPLTEAVGHPEWQTDERFSTPGARAQNATELIGQLDAIFATRPLAEWAGIFDGLEDFFWAPVQSVEEVVSDPQVRAAGGLIEVPDGDSTTTLPNTPVDFGRTRCEPRWMAPDLGQHSEEVLRELGRDEAQIDALRQRGVVD
ncbi:MAG: CoA transferase [Proteobacteria bacterium]|nr:CoA transferase [Pseudomonadota bacterium]